MFNDSFALYNYSDDTYRTRQLICNGSDFDKATNTPLSAPGNCYKKGVAWTSDVSSKFLKPYLSNTVWSAMRSFYGASNVSTTNEFLANGWYANETGHAVPVVTDEDFMVWMRTAALPDFRKLYRVIDTALEPGFYGMDIIQMYDVSNFGGSKAFALSTLSWVGGSNPFLSTTYLVVGFAALAFSLTFVVLHFVCGDRSHKAIEELMNDRL
jgi:hypothetical protein